MQRIIDPIEKHLLVLELTPDKFLRKANRGGNEIYSFTFHDSPHLMLEVARLREIAFRHAAGGKGAILVTIRDIYPNKIARHIGTYQKTKPDYALVEDSLQSK